MGHSLGAEMAFTIALQDPAVKVLSVSGFAYTTGASQTLISRERFATARQRSARQPVFILDLAAPRDFDPEIASLDENVFLYDLDALEETCERNRRARRGEIQKAQDIINHQTRTFMQEIYHRATGPVINRLREHWHDISRAELDRCIDRAAGSTCSVGPSCFHRGLGAARGDHAVFADIVRRFARACCCHVGAVWIDLSGGGFGRWHRLAADARRPRVAACENSGRCAGQAARSCRAIAAGFHLDRCLQFH